MFDLVNHQPRSGKSAPMNQMAADLAGKTNMAETIIGNCTTAIPMKFNFHDGEIGHTVVIGPTGKGMSCFEN
ncbi:hypothetical protein [Accumulibacter sp.]|uniref:hypothetical protein n=2 Tax=Accumulibacter sp. TaxID=2053492 RepID=UPI002BA96E04|nr:hypothetical protein [Accumulibacter sp.]HNB69428.1 hypothetical protein [Accumulibacter sp.]